VTRVRPQFPGRRGLVFALTFVVAFCSIVYELIYSELLAVLFGGTVVRYSITIGLFLFSLGVGAFLFRYLDDHPSNFFRLEVYLALAGPLGLVFIVGVNSLPVSGSPDVEAAIETVLLLASHLPIVVVGLLSGLEIPFLTNLADAEDDAAVTGMGALGWLGRASRRLVRGVIALLFVTARGGAESEDPESAAHEEHSFSKVLGMDYLGSLVGTVAWALVLYPTLGLITSVFVLGLLNALAALAFYWAYRDATSVDVTFGTPSRALLALCLVTSAAYVGALSSDGAVENQLRDAYLEEEFTGEYPQRQMAIQVTEHHRTRYQNVVLYEREWTGSTALYEGAVGPETCLRLDTAIQLCESWVEPYHHGLVDVPMALFENRSNPRVLLVGGGDWIAVNRLRAYGVRVDQVDIDTEFMQLTRNHPFFVQYHQQAYGYDRLDTTAADAYAYLRDTDRQYDLVLLDLPGARSDDLLHLYSTEFYRQVRGHLTEDGVVATWAYSRYGYATHRKAYLNTVRAAGFESYLPYDSYGDLNGDGNAERVEHYYLLSPGPTSDLPTGNGTTDYVAEYRDRYASAAWGDIPHYRGVRPNSVFHPNYDIIVDR
jgi:spermidine synthase